MYVAAQKTFLFPLQFNSNGERNTYKNILTNDPFSNLLCNCAKNGIRVVVVERGIFLWCCYASSASCCCFFCRLKNRLIFGEKTFDTANLFSPITLSAFLARILVVSAELASSICYLFYATRVRKGA